MIQNRKRLKIYNQFKKKKILKQTARHNMNLYGFRGLGNT